MRIFRPKFSIRGLEPDPPKPQLPKKPLYGNKPEEEFYLQAKAAGWEPTKKGWPDFIIRRGGRVAFVEVKPDGNSQQAQLSAHQYSVMQDLARLGAECYLWSRKAGFRRIGPQGPFRQRQNRSGKVGDERGSQSPDAGSTTERAHAVGVKTATYGAKP